MDIRREALAAAVRLAFVVSTIAVGLTFLLDATGNLNPARLVSAVAVVGFVSSCLMTGRVWRTVAA
jgi:hypothetical protein